jgi:hypothetical protein
MGLKFEVASLEGLDESISSHYVEKDGKYYLDVDGVVSKKKHDEFRQNNIDLKKQLESYGGLTAEEALRYKTAAESGNIDEARLNSSIESRVKGLREEFAAKETEYTSTIGALSGKLSSVLIDSEVKGAAVKGAVMPTALDDVMLRARTVFKLQDGAVQAFDDRGNLMYDKDGTTPLGIEAWVKSLKKTAPHLFEGNSGAGASGMNRSGANGRALTAVQKISQGM